MNASIAVAWLDGALVPRAQARLPIDDFAVRYGVACFETMRAAGDRVFRLEAHLQRLFGGLTALGVEPQERLSAAALTRAIVATIAANELEEASVRLTVTAGRGYTPDLGGAHAPSVIVTADPLPFPGPAPRLRLARVEVDARRPLAGAKTAQYLVSLLARTEVRDAGADDALLLNHEGALVEAATANLFLLTGDRLLTPPLSDGPLPGITRGVVGEIAPRIGLTVEERTLRPPDLAAADAVLLTSSIAGITPVISVEGRDGEALWRAGDGEPPAIAALWEAYETLVVSEIGPPRALVERGEGGEGAAPDALD